MGERLMELGSPEWQTSVAIIRDILKSHVVDFSMGSFLYRKENKTVTVKHRLRRDRTAVTTFACWLKKDPDQLTTLDNIKWTVTTSTPKGDVAHQLGQQLLNFLETGKIPKIDLEQHEDYKDF